MRPVENMEERRDMLDGIYKELAEIQKNRGYGKGT